MARLNPQYLILGEILRPHGVRGELRMRVLTDYPERIMEVETVYIGNDPNALAEPYQVRSARFHKDYLLIAFDEIPDRTAAEAYRGLYIMIDLQHAVPLEDDEYYLYEVIGMQVNTTDGTEVGTISDVIETGANDVFVVKSRRFGEILLPAHEETIVEFQNEAGIIIMEIPEGLLPEE